MRSLFHGSLGSGIKEDIGVVSGILGLDESVQLSVLWRFLTEDRVAVGRWIRGEVLRDQCQRLRVQVLIRYEHLQEACSSRLDDTPAQAESSLLLWRHRIAEQYLHVYCVSKIFE